MTTKPETDQAAYTPNADGSPPMEKASMFEDFIDIFYAPSSVFARRAKSGFGLYLLIVSAIGALFAFANRSVASAIFEAEYQRNAARMMAQNPQLTADAMEKGRGFAQMGAQIMMYVGTPLLILVVALLLWGAARAFSAKITYGQAALISTLAFIPRLLGTLLVVVQGLLMDAGKFTSMASATWSPARFLDADTANRQVMAILMRFDLFTLWATVLLGIGVAVMGKVSRGRAFGAAAVVWLVPTLLALLQR